MNRVTDATELLRRMRPPEALACLGPDAQFAGRSPDTLALLAEIYLALGRTADAHRLFSEVINMPMSVGTGSIDARRGRARLLMAEGNLADARSLIEDTLRWFDPFGLDMMATETWMSYENLRFLLGEIALAEGKLREAAAIYEECWNPKNDRTYWVQMWNDGYWACEFAKDAVTQRLGVIEKLRRSNGHGDWGTGPLPAAR